MKYPVKGFKNLQVGLKELEPFIRNGEHLQTGKPFGTLSGMLSREVLANWLICVAYNFASQADRLTFTSDPLGGDGIIRDNATEEIFPTEHVMVPRARTGKADDAGALILKAVEHKRNKGGAAYASGKTLVVFLNRAGGMWFPNAVTKQLPEPLYFAAVWVVGTHGMNEGRHVYSVSSLELVEGNAPTWLVRIGVDFNAWEVIAVQ